MLTLGQTGWCIEPDIEAEGYGDGEPRKPWFGTVTKIMENKNFPERSGYRLSYTSTTGEIDEDSNATAYIKETEIYPSNELAVTAYKKAMRSYIDGLIDTVQQLEKQLRDY